MRSTNKFLRFYFATYSVRSLSRSCSSGCSWIERLKSEIMGAVRLLKTVPSEISMPNSRIMPQQTTYIIYLNKSVFVLVVNKILRRYLNPKFDNQKKVLWYFVCHCYVCSDKAAVLVIMSPQTLHSVYWRPCCNID